ncbi:MAG: DUF4831 family protein [Prevotellaceae bacterium]|jgi:hypothetical protein|nr:DUF4831 family protein [Prevotellaceae bacterium]
MKLLKPLYLIGMLTCSSAFAQQLPQGVVVYALPSTSVQLQVEAVCEVFTAGPYAKFAPKYLGIEAQAENKDIYSLKSVNVVPFVEADASQTYTAALKDGKSSANFLAVTAVGLVALFENNASVPIPWRFASNVREAGFDNRGYVSNLATTTTTFYKTVKTDTGFERVPVQQSQVVEKSVERRAEETANMIYSLRKKRIDLLTGDVDNLPAGDAMRAVLEEITRLEDAYVSLFTGKSSFDVQTMTFDVTPNALQPKQLYIAFRFSDTQGLLSPANLAGRPIMLELTPEKEVSAMPSNASDVDKKGTRIHYRIPAVVQARVLDGQTTLWQTRFPVYQLGSIMTVPINMAR